MEYCSGLIESGLIEQTVKRLEVFGGRWTWSWTVGFPHTECQRQEIDNLGSPRNQLCRVFSMEERWTSQISIQLFLVTSFIRCPQGNVNYNITKALIIKCLSYSYERTERADMQWPSTD